MGNPVTLESISVEEFVEKNNIGTKLMLGDCQAVIMEAQIGLDNRNHKFLVEARSLDGRSSLAVVNQNEILGIIERNGDDIIKCKQIYGYRGALDPHENKDIYNQAVKYGLLPGYNGHCR